MDNNTNTGTNDMNMGNLGRGSGKRTAKWIAAAIIIIALAALANSVIFVVQENEIALVSRFSEIVRNIDTAGIQFKLPFIEEVRILPKDKMFYYVADMHLLTSDTIAMIANSFVVWRIYDPIMFFRTVGTLSTAQGRLQISMSSATQRIINTMTQEAIISAYEDGRDRLNQTIRDIVRSEAREYGVEIVDVKIRRFDLPLENEAAVFLRMISDRERLAEYFRADGRYQADLIRNEVDMNRGIIVSNAREEAERIIAEGEEEYMRILSEAYNTPAREEFFLFIRGLEALRESLSGSDNTVILDRDSTLARILVSP